VGAIQQSEVIRGSVELSRKDQGIKSGIRLDPALMTESNDLGQFGLAEIIRAKACIESRQAEVNGIGAICRSRPHAIPIARGGEQFGLGGNREIHGGRRKAKGN
jgi:hypothetical protein